jgi:DUF971 family protein
MDRFLRASQANRATENHKEDSLMLPEGAIVGIAAAVQVGNYTLRVSFSDGAERVIDFEPFLRGSQNPQIRAYLDAAKFRDFHVEDGDLVWDDYGLCFPIADLYENRI